MDTALEWLANLSSNIPNRVEQMMRYHGFAIIIRDFSTTGNPHFYSKMEVEDKVESAILPIRRF